MESRIGTFVLRFAATAILFAPAAPAQAQGIGQSVCRDVLVPGRVGAIGNDERAHHEQVCNQVYYPPPPPPPPEPPVRHTTGSESTVPIDPVAEARKTQLRARESHPSGQTGGSAVHRDPPSLCPPPYRMTASDGCQK
jgi:hypothetical protein